MAVQCRNCVGFISVLSLRRMSKGTYHGVTSLLRGDEDERRQAQHKAADQ
jgi:hypothetical protein